jgi:endonuclease/exonuclease/phosphatase family metal-dependent hydrolase
MRSRSLSPFAPLLSAALLAACGPAPSEPAASAAPVSASATERGNAGGNKLVKVMTRNLYLGGDLGRVFGKTGLEFLLATTDVWTMVQRNDFEVRAEAIADEIDAARPDVIGLQEVYTWRIQVPGDFLAGQLAPNAETVAYDFLGLLQAALASRGLAYRVAAQVELADLEAPVLTGPPTPEGVPTADVRLTDHEVILVRADAQTRNPEARVFDDLASAPLPTGPVPVKRGWVEVDVKHHGAWFRFVSTHLEAFSPAIRTLQAEQLASELEDVPGRLIVVGDTNSRPDGTDADGGAAYQALLGACLVDAWPAVERDALGYTSGWAEDLTLTEDPTTGEPLALYERIDQVFFRGAVSARAVEVVGDELSDRVGGLWPSDHAGVIATLRLENPRFFPGPRCDCRAPWGRGGPRHRGERPGR